MRALRETVYSKFTWQLLRKYDRITGSSHWRISYWCAEMWTLRKLTCVPMIFSSSHSCPNFSPYFFSFSRNNFCFQSLISYSLMPDRTVFIHPCLSLLNKTNIERKRILSKNCLTVSAIPIAFIDQYIKVVIWPIQAHSYTHTLWLDCK